MESKKINAISLLRVAPLAALAAAAINAALFFLGDAIGMVDKTTGVPQSDGSMKYITLPLMMQASIIPVLLGGLILALLNRFTANPLRIYRIITLAAILLFMVSPFLAFPVPMGIWLNITHLVVGGVAWYAYSRYTKG